MEGNAVCAFLPDPDEEVIGTSAAEGVAVDGREIFSELKWVRGR
jgi:hypothetical protein